MASRNAIQYGPDFPGLDQVRLPDATPGAGLAVNCRFDQGALEGLETCRPLSVFGRSPGRIQAIGGAEGRNLIAAGGGVYVDGVAVTDAAGDAVDLGNAEAPASIAESGDRIYLSAGAAVYWLDRRLMGQAQCAFKLEAPGKPGDATAAITTLESNEVDALTHSTRESSLDAVTNYVLVGGPNFDNTSWNTEWFGVPTPHLKPNTTQSDGDGFYFDASGAPMDWSGFTSLYLDVASDEAGTMWGFAFGEDAIDTAAPAWGGTVIPLTISESSKIVTLQILLTSVPPSSRNAVKWWGIILIRSNPPSAGVNFKSLRAESGTTGVRDYAFTLRRDDTIGDVTEEFRSQENISLTSINAGATGASVTITFAEPVPAGHVMEIWRRDEDIATQYHFVGTAAAGATSYVDATNDVSDGVTLRTGRAGVPASHTCLFTHAGRLGLFSDGRLWLSAVGDPTFFLDMTVEEYLDLTAAGSTVTNTDGVKVVLGGVGSIVAAAGMGVTTADQYSTETLLMSEDGWDVLLQGVTLDELSVARRQPGGCTNEGAWTRLPDGRIAKVEPGGDFALVDQHMQRQNLIAGRLLPLVSAATGECYTLFDLRTKRAALFNGPVAGYVWDFEAGKWTAWVPTTADATDAVTAAGGWWQDGVWLAVFGTASGRLYGVFTGDSSEPFTWEGPEWNTGIDAWHPTRLRTRGSGTGTVRVEVDGAEQGRAEVDASRRLAHKTGRVVAVRVDGAAGAALHRVDVEMTRRGR